MTPQTTLLEQQPGQLGAENDRTIDAGGARRLPRIRATTASRGLLFGEEDAAFRSAFRRSGHSRGVGRADLVEVMKVRFEDRAPYQRPKNFGQQ